MLRPWLDGKLAGCPGGESLALGLLEGGMGLFVLHPRPWQPTQGCVPQQRQGQLPDSGGVCLEVGLCHGWCRSENISGGGKDTTFDYSLYRFPRLFFQQCCLLIPGKDIKEELAGLSICGGGKEAGRERWGRSKLSPFQQHLFPFISLRCVSPAWPGLD